jgi:hypothetical protein
MYLAGEMGRGINAAFKQVEQATQGISSGTFTVSSDNILAAGRIIESQATTLFELWKTRSRDLRVLPPGDDAVSERMALAWNDRLFEDDDSYRNRIRDYILGLRKLAVQLGDAAKAYGYTEDEISAAFGKTGA